MNVRRAVCWNKFSQNHVVEYVESFQICCRKPYIDSITFMLSRQQGQTQLLEAGILAGCVRVKGKWVNPPCTESPYIVVETLTFSNPSTPLCSDCLPIGLGGLGTVKPAFPGYIFYNLSICRTSAYRDKRIFGPSICLIDSRNSSFKSYFTF